MELVTDTVLEPMVLGKVVQLVSLDRVIGAVLEPVVLGRVVPLVSTELATLNKKLGPTLLRTTEEQDDAGYT